MQAGSATLSPSHAASAPDAAAHPRMTKMLRLEGLALLAGAAMLYPSAGHGWGWFFALFLVPDLSLLGYLGSRRIGAAVYNVGHHLAIPAVLAVLGVFLGGNFLLACAAIWAAHIGFDRALGYGLKYSSGFRDTHLGRI
jgi:hypothetical protein